MSNLQSAPVQSYQWLRPLLPRRLQPALRSLRKRRQLARIRLEEPYRSVYTHTQVSLPRQRSLVQLCETIENERIPGAVVECGVLDGGTAALMSHATSGSGRPVHLFDAWLGLPKTSTQDGADAVKWEGQVVGSPKRVMKIMDRLNVSRERIHVHKGWFHDTFPHADIPQIALLHIDCDFYEPTRLCLERWTPHMAPGGFIQIDDYAAFEGCRAATDEYLAGRPDLELTISPRAGGPVFLRRQPAPGVTAESERS